MGRGKQLPTPLTAGFATAVQIEQARLGVSQKQLAERAGMPTSTLSKKLSQASIVTLVDVELLARALGMEPHDLVLAAEREMPRPTPPDVFALAADYTAELTDRERFEAEHDHDEPA